jgi:hypothetical protein
MNELTHTFAPPRTGELSAKLTEGAGQARLFEVCASVAPSDRFAIASPACGEGNTFQGVLPR